MRLSEFYGTSAKHARIEVLRAVEPNGYNPADAAWNRWVRHLCDVLHVNREGRCSADYERELESKLNKALGCIA